MPVRKRVTLNDVAKETGVSAKTVSNVVNSSGWVSDPVRDRILEAITRLGYQPNLAARQLRIGKSHMFALAVPTLREPYFAELASSFVTQAQKLNVTVLITETRGKRESEFATIQGKSLPGVDAIICSPLALTEKDLQHRSSTIPLVLLGEYASNFNEPLFSFQVGFDNTSAAYVATNHLLALGAHRIAVIGHQEDTSQATSRLRFQGYLSALREAKVPFDKYLLGTVDDFNRKEAALALQRIIDLGVEFDGLLCFSDTMVLGVLPTLAANDSTRNKQIPIVGFDNIEEASYAYPPFDTIDPHMDVIASTVIQRLLDQSDSSNNEMGVHIETPFELVVRTRTDPKAS